MVLYKEEVANIDLSSSELPKTQSCLALKRAYNDGFIARVKSGIRWVNADDINHYKCSAHDSSYCRNIPAIITNLKKGDEGIVSQCTRDIRLANAIKRARRSVPKEVESSDLILERVEAKRLNAKMADEHLRQEEERINSEKEKTRLANQEKIRKEVERDIIEKQIFDKLAKVDFEGIKPLNIDLSANMYSLVENVISSVDVNDFKGEVVLGVSKNLPITLEQVEPYSVLQVAKDRVYLSCGQECGLPIIGIVRVNERPSPIEKIEYNDTRAVYMFVGVEHFYAKRDHLKGDSNQVQALLFHRITLRELGLPRKFFEKSENDLSVLN